MKKLFTLLTLALLSIGTAWAAIGDTFTVTFNGSAVQTTENYFTLNGNSFNTKFTGATYDNVTYTSGFKMESSTSISWSAAAAHTLIILQSDWQDKNNAHGTPKTNKLDGTEIATNTATTGTGYYLYTIENVAAGNHSITRGSGENGLFMVRVVYTGESVDIVANPQITWNSETKKASITCATDGATIYYTTDGTTPTTSSDVYSSEISITNSTTVCAFAKKGETTSDLVKKDCYVDHSTSAIAVLNRGDAADAPTWTDGVYSITSSDANDIQYYTIFNGKDGFKLNAGTTYTIDIPEGIKVTSVKLVGKTRGDAANNTTVSFTGCTPASAEFEKGTFVKTVEYTPSTALDFGDDLSFEVGGNQFGAYIELYGAVKTYTVTYDAGANGSGSIAAGEKKYGVDFTLSSSTFTRDGFTQTGWATSDGGPQVYALGGSYTANADITLYPVWSKVVTTVVNSWDFSNWSAATIAGVKADAPAAAEGVAEVDDGLGWRCYEDNTTDKYLGEGCYFNKKAMTTLKYGTTTIPETEGLTFDNTAYKYGLAFDYQTVPNMGTMHGAKYLWLYGSIVISSVPAGSIIEIGVESHNPAKERGVTLSGGGATLTNGEAKAKTYQVCTWTVPTGGNVTIATNGGGVHLYYITVTKDEETIPVSTKADRNYATCIATKQLDFASAEGITAYIATGLNGASDAVVLQEVDVVPAGTPIIVKTDTKGATVNVPVTDAAASDVSGNKLIAGDGTTAWNGTSGYKYYYLASDQFHEATSGTLQSGKAYLKVSTTAAPVLNINFGETTGIDSVKASEFKANGEYYNLAGQRVAQPTKGLYIVNGRKVIVK